MKFIYETSKEVEHVFDDVEISQFFVRLNGDLCQKINKESYNVVARKDGTPCAEHFFNSHSFNSFGFGIERILPKVVKIEF